MLYPSCMVLTTPIHRTVSPLGFALLGALALVLLYAAVPAEYLGALEHQVTLMWSQPWRLLSAHWVHWNAAHVWINALAWIALGRLFAPELSPTRQMLTVLTASLTISLSLAWSAPELTVYRGFSGVLHALYFAGALLWWRAATRAQKIWPTLLWVGGLIKVLLEAPWRAHAPWSEVLDIHVAVQAHAVGALTGMVLGGLFSSGAHAARPEQEP